MLVLALTVLYVALTGLYLALTVLYLNLTVLYLDLTVLRGDDAGEHPGDGHGEHLAEDVDGGRYPVLVLDGHRLQERAPLDTGPEFFANPGILLQACIRIVCILSSQGNCKPAYEPYTNRWLRFAKPGKRRVSTPQPSACTGAPHS